MKRPTAVTPEEKVAALEAAAAAVARKISKYIKSHGGRIGEVMHGLLSSEVAYVTVESNFQVAREMAEYVNTTPYMEVIQASDDAGHFDWAADTYIKDSSTVTFKRS